MSGGIAHRGGVLDTGWDRTEARVFADGARPRACPPRRSCSRRGRRTPPTTSSSAAPWRGGRAQPRRLLVVAKPYMTRRGFATGREKWPEVELVMQCEEIGVADYFAREADPERTLLALVGDLHRILVYPAMGFQIAQDVPAPVIEALRASSTRATARACCPATTSANRRSRLPRR